MRSGTAFFILFLIALSPKSSHGSVVNAVGLEPTLRGAWAISPVLQASEIQSQILEGDRYRRFLFSAPQFQYSSTDDRTGSSYGLIFSTGFPGKAFGLMGLDRVKAQAQKAEFRAKKHELTKTIATAFIDCASAKLGQALQKEIRDDLFRLSQKIRAIYESGKSSQAEKIGAELQARQAELDLVSAQDRYQTACQKLNGVLRVSHVDEIDSEQADPELPDDWSAEFLGELGNETPDEARAGAAIETARITASTAWWMQVPDLNFGISRNHYLYLPGSPNGEAWTTSYSVGITIPVFFPFRESVEVSRTRSQAAQDENAAELAQTLARSERNEGRREYQRSLNRLHELRLHDLPLAVALVESTYSAYQSGRMGYAELVLSRRTLVDLRNQEIQLRVSILNSHLKCLNQCEVKS